MKHPDINLQFLDGGGEMGKLIREKDWSTTSLGSPRFWQQSLRTTLSIILHSKFPMFLFWGEELICFYNDAFRPSLGKEGKHPSILGVKGETAWKEIWHTIKPFIDQVFAGGEAVLNEDQLISIFRNGKIEDVFWTFSYSPVNDESGKPAGVFVTCSETTDKIITRNRLQDNKKELEFAVEAAQLGTWDYNPFTNKFSSNERLKEWFGLPAHEQIELYHAIDAIAEKDRQRVEEAIRKTLDFSSGGNYDIQFTIVEPVTKKETTVRAKGKVWFNEEKVAYRFNGILEDVTKAEEAAKILGISEQRFQAAIEAVQGILWTNNAKGEMEGEQVGWALLTGQTYEEYQGYGWAKAVHPDDAQPTIDAWNEAVEELRAFDFEHRVKTKDGIWRDFSIRAIPLLDSDGTLVEWVGVHTDITEKKVTETNIRESEKHFRRLIDIVPAIVWITEPDGYCSYLNKQWYDYTGQSIKEGEGFGWLDATHPDDAEAAGKAFIKANSEQKPFTHTYRLRNKKGDYRWAVDSGSPKFSIDGKYEGMIGTVVDIHDEKIAIELIKESEKKFRFLADSLPQHIWTSDPDGKMNYFNKSVFDYSGLSFEQIYKDGWLQIVHPDDRERNSKEWMEAIRTGKDFLSEHRFRKHTGEYRWQLSRAIAQKDENGKIQMWVGTSTDIEEQKNFTNELKKQVAERTKALEDNNVKLEKMNKELESFAYVSSHDLQEPLRKIQTFSMRIIETENESLSDKGKDYFMRMQDAALRMQTLINDLLSYSRTATGERKYEIIDLRVLVEEVKADLKEELQQKNATVEAMGLCQVKVITFQFRQLLFNLISNSLKFSKSSFAPHIKIQCEIAKGDTFNISKLTDKKTYCHISISDNGIGFEQKYSERIFELFQRLHGKQEYKGTGIGLAIVKKIVENHQGIIMASSELDKGTTFDIYLPVT